jgi:hypothetical protein
VDNQFPFKPMWIFLKEPVVKYKELGVIFTVYA